MEKEEKVRDVWCKQAIWLEQIRYNERIECIEEQYHAETSQHNTGPLLLDAVLVPVEESTPTIHSESFHTAQCIEYVRIARSERKFK